MSKIFLDFRPADYHKGKECYVSYYVRNPLSDTLERKKIKLNHIHKAKEREKYAIVLCKKINEKLYAGWNPYFEVSKETSGITLQKAVEMYMEEKCKILRKDSIRSYESFAKTLLHYANSKKIKFLISFNEQHAVDIMSYLIDKKHVSAKTHNNYLIMFRTVFNYFIKKKMIKENPFANIESKRKEEKMRKTIPRDIREKITHYFVDSKQIPYLYIMQLCYRCFIRPKEILMLKIKHIDFDNAMLLVPANISKNHKEDIFAVPDEIMRYFDTLKSEPGNKYIFSDRWLPGYTLLNSRDTGRAWAYMRKALGLPIEYQFYSLKDTGITEMLESGVPAKIVRDLARHSSLEITEKYVHKANAKKILEWNKLEF